jgi:glycosyltransferase involved in cell wall biosynthesis
LIENAQSRPIRVLQALTTAELGGTERMVLRLLEHTDRARVECDLSVLDGDGPVLAHARELGVRTIDLTGSGGPMGAGRRFRRLLVEGRYDVVHFYGFRMSLIGRAAARLIGPRPRVIHGIRGVHVTESADISTPKTRAAIAIERLFSGLIDLYVANSSDAVHYLRSHGVRGRFVVIYSGIEPSEFDPEHRRFDADDARGAAGLTRAAEVITVARFRPGKRHEDLIAAIRQLRARGVRVLCTMVGDGPTRTSVESLVREWSLHDEVRFAGECAPHQIPALLARADVFVLPSLREGLPGSVMEAMATGLPVVATDVPGTRELVVDGVTGYLVAPKDPTALADRLQQLLDDESTRRAMGREGRRRVLTVFSMSQMIERHEELYEALASKAPWPAWAAAALQPIGASATSR